MFPGDGKKPVLTDAGRRKISAADDNVAIVREWRMSKKESSDVDAGNEGAQ